MSSAADRVLARIEVNPAGCWEFMGSLDKGYGVVGYHRDDGIKATMRAHRAVYEDWIGPIPANHDLDHLCLNPRCVNPSHLEPVTRSENVRRQWAAGRADPGRPHRLKTHCRQGHEYDEANTHITPAGGRSCRACNRERARRNYIPRSKT